MGDSTKRKPRILVVDDTELFLVLMEEILSKEGFEVITAKHGLEALDKINEQFPDLDVVLLDLLLPKMTGFDVLKEVRKDNKFHSLPILAISNVFKDSSHVETLRVLGADGFMTKDLSPEEILQRVTLVLEKPEAKTG